MYKVIFILIIFVFSTSIQANIYRCTDTEGNVSYSEKPCAKQQQTKELKRRHFELLKPKVCSELTLVVKKMYPKIRGRKNMDKVYERLERKISLSKPMHKVVNYLASYRFNKSLSNRRIMTMTKDRCLRGGFGDITEQDFPPSSSGFDGMIEKMTKRQQEQRMQAEQQHRKNIKQVCGKYTSMLKIYDKRLSGPMDEIERAKLQADRDMMLSIKNENCKKSN